MILIWHFKKKVYLKEINSEKKKKKTKFESLKYTANPRLDSWMISHQLNTNISPLTKLLNLLTTLEFKYFEYSGPSN